MKPVKNLSFPSTTIADAERCCFHKLRLSSACVLSMIWARLRLSLLLFRRERAVFLLLHLCRPQRLWILPDLPGRLHHSANSLLKALTAESAKKRWIWTAGRKKHRNAVQCPHFVFIRLRKASRCGLCQRSEYFADGHRFIFKNKGENTLSIGG